MIKFHIDFETHSELDLNEVGVDRYTKHPSTDVWCMGFATNDEEVGCLPQNLFKSIKTSLIHENVLVFAHSAFFEYAIWNNIMVPRYGWPVLSLKQLRCTMAMCYAMAIPGSLEKAAAALGIKEQKDIEGQRLMKQMASPKEDNTLWGDSEKLARLYEYCKQDVRVERELEKRLLSLSEKEQAIWEMDQEINLKGFALDTPAVKAAMGIIQVESLRLNEEIRKETNNFVGFTSEVARITKWIVSKGVPVDNGIGKSEITNLLEMCDLLPKEVVKVLEIRREAGKTSTSKLKTVIDSCSADGRIRNTLQYHGAATGRWSGRRIQPHNLPRPILSEKEIFEVLDFIPRMPPEEAIEKIQILYGSPMHVISDCLRGMIVAGEGSELVSGDYSNIEGRVVAWLANEDWKLKAFKEQDMGTGPEIYLLAASKIYHKNISELNKKSPERQIGKVAELACGFGGSVGAFQTMAKTYGVKVPDANAKVIVDEWRASHPNIQKFWYSVEEAAYNAVKTPGQPFSSSPKVCFKVQGSFLFCKLPAGRVLTYPYPKLKMKKTPWGELKDTVHYMAVNSLTNKWEEVSTYGGKLVENITQAVARDVLTDAMVKLHSGFYGDIVLHVHDEIVLEDAMVDKSQLFEMMAECPDWAIGLPLKVTGWKGRRYRK